MAQQGFAEAAVIKFRRMLVEDAAYRAKFADDPAAALRAVGIDIPPEVKVPKVDKQELEDRIKKLKEVFGDKLESLYATTDVSAFAVSPQAAKLNSLATFSALDARRLGGGSGVYTISAFGTADW